MKDKEIIGIVGGMGPYAGLELVKKIFDLTEANSDGEHLSVFLSSMPSQIEDRTSYLLGEVTTNPAYAISKIILDLEKIGSRIVAIPCNTSHAPPIFDEIIKNLRQNKSQVKLVHMIDEVAKFIKSDRPQLKKLGVLCTSGSYKTRLYPNILEPQGFEVIMPNPTMQQRIHQAIYHKEYGIKSQSNPINKSAKKELLQAINSLQNAGAEAIILGCTEIPLAITEHKIGSTLILEPLLILARALIQEINPSKIKPSKDE